MTLYSARKNGHLNTHNLHDQGTTSFCYWYVYYRMHSYTLVLAGMCVAKNIKEVCSVVTPEPSFYVVCTKDKCVQIHRVVLAMGQV